MRQHNPFIKLRLKVRRDWDSVWPDEEDFEAYKDQDERDLASFRKIRRTERYAMEQSKTDEDKKEDSEREEKYPKYQEIKYPRYYI